MILSLSMLAGLVVSGMVSVWLWRAHDIAQERETTMAQTVMQLEHATGYAGFIHNFKNAVLRPDEPVYIRYAADDYDKAVTAIAQLETLAAEAGVAIDLTLYRNTLNRYRQNLDVLRETRHRFDQIPQTDALVRVPDAAARNNLDLATQRLARALEERTEPLRRALAISLGTMLVLVTLLGREQSYNARHREQHLALEAQRQRLAAERRHGEQLAATLAQVQQVNREQAEFTYAVSHDLKAPVNTAGMLVSALREEMEDRLTEDDAELLGDLDAVLQRMHGLIEDVLHYTSSFETRSHTEPVDLDKILDAALADMRGQILQTHAIVERLPLPAMVGNRRQIRNLLQNLLENALKFHAPGMAPHIRIAPPEAGTQAGRVAFSICDNGIGVAPQDAERIFALFGRLHDRESYPGTGLGLAICRRIAKAHGGDVSVGPSPLGGSCFTVTLQESPE